jgi:hypothetical protein
MSTSTSETSHQQLDCSSSSSAYARRSGLSVSDYWKIETRRSKHSRLENAIDLLCLDKRTKVYEFKVAYATAQLEETQIPPWPDLPGMRRQ